MKITHNPIPQKKGTVLETHSFHFSFKSMPTSVNILRKIFSVVGQCHDLFYPTPIITYCICCDILHSPVLRDWHFHMILRMRKGGRPASQANGRTGQMVGDQWYLEGANGLWSAVCVRCHARRKVATPCHTPPLSPPKLRQSRCSQGENGYASHASSSLCSNSLYVCLEENELSLNSVIFFFCHIACGNLGSLTRDGNCAFCIGSRVLTTGPPRECLLTSF